MDDTNKDKRISRSQVKAGSKDVKILKATIDPESKSTILIENNTKTPQISYRVININTQNASFPSTTSSPSSFLLMMQNNQNQDQNTLIKKSDNFQKSLVDQKRRMTHKEIEKRRRCKINDWIIALSKEVPECASDQTKQGQSKGGILAKTAKYIQELRAENNNLINEKEQLRLELNQMMKKLNEMEDENNSLKSILESKEFYHSK